MTIAKSFLVFCDDSGMHGGATHYAFGSIWIPQQRRGTLWGIVNQLRNEHGYSDEIKWSNVGKRSEHFYVRLVQLFFERRWIMFHSLIVKRALVDRKAHGGDMDLARRKHFALLLANKLCFFCDDASKSFHIRTDVIPSRYGKADEAAHKIINNATRRKVGTELVKTFRTVDSKNSVGVQLADLFLGAVMSDRHGDATAKAKLDVKAEIARHLGWKDLAADTRHTEWKFNIWEFCNPNARTVATRPVRLIVKHPTLELIRRSRRNG